MPSMLPRHVRRLCCCRFYYQLWQCCQKVTIIWHRNSAYACEAYIQRLSCLLILPPEQRRLLLQVACCSKQGAANFKGDSLSRLKRATWLESTVWPPSTWSVFGCSVRSNNDVEGWHRRLNAKAQHGQLNLYLLLSLLASEAAIVNVTVTAMKESAVVRYQRVSSRKTTARLHRVWDRLRSNERSVRQTLRAASHVVATFGHWVIPWHAF